MATFIDCYFAANFVQFISTPLLILSSHEDSVFTRAFGCAPDYGTPEYEEFRELWMQVLFLQILFIIKIPNFNI